MSRQAGWWPGKCPFLFLLFFDMDIVTTEIALLNFDTVQEKILS